MCRRRPGRSSWPRADGVSDLVVFFFFSSRRRHTRFSRDWSSDVCSSDLNCPMSKDEYDRFYDALLSAESVEERDWEKLRSEERRVGKECRSRWALDH